MFIIFKYVETIYKNKKIKYKKTKNLAKFNNLSIFEKLLIMKNIFK